MSTQDTSYNGWKNYETWAVGMWLDGNYDGEGTYREVLDLVRGLLDTIEATDVWTLKEARKFGVADALKEYFEQRVTDDIGGIAGDLLRAAKDEVDWDELAEAKTSELQEAS